MVSKRHRILYIEKPTSVGGSVISMYELIRGLDSTCYEPIVLFHGPNPYREQFQAIGVRVIVLNEKAATTTAKTIALESSRDIAASLARYSHWLANLYKAAKETYLIIRRERPLAYKLAQLIRDEEIDLVHHNGSLPKNRDTIWAARLAGVPQVCHVRMLHKFSFWERYLARSVNAFIYISKAVQQLYHNLGIPAHKGQVVYNPFDIETLAQGNHTTDLRAEFGVTDQGQLISNVGRIDWWKGQDDFLRAIAEVTQSHPHTKALIVGQPDTNPWSVAYYQQLQKLVVDLNLSEHVIFTGFRSDIPDIMNASDIIVHSASEPEPFGRVVVEGMAAGKPVIATAAGGVLDIIEDQVTGLLIPPKNAQAMANAICQFLQDQTQAKTVGQRAQKRAEERFSVSQHVTSVERIYQDILSS